MLSQAVTIQKTRFIKIREVLSRVGLSRASIYNKMKEGTFPKNFKLGGGRSMAWLESSIDEWIDSVLESNVADS